MIAKAQNPRIQLGKVASIIRGLVSIKTQELQANYDKLAGKPGIDLICVIDRSGSMGGEKIELVKKTLLLLVTLLTEQDRLSLILFDSRAEWLNDLIPVSKENIPKFQELIQKIQSCGGTCIGSGTDIAFNIIKNRKHRNQVTSIFVLGDGQDGSAKYDSSLNEFLIIIILA